MAPAADAPRAPAETYPQSPLLSEGHEKHWGHFRAGLGLSCFFSLFALFALFFIQKSNLPLKFYLFGCAVGLGLWFMGFLLLSFACT